ncbi:MAG: TetR/AcrR family transcriptional regulator [Actinobacteria bacterium]|nr:TetR/AcrR family transcriptional regulator [Actinomycetota bacterium]
MARTQEERKAETRAKLLAAAADLFASKGFHAVSAEAVADAADRTTGALYSHFGGKDGLLLALLDEWERSAGRQMRDALNDASSHRDRVEGLWSTFIEPADAQNEDWMLLEHELWLFAARNLEARQVLADRFALARVAMGQSFERWADDDGRELDAAEGERLGALVLGLLLGLEMQRHVDAAAIPDDVAFDGLRRLFGESPSTNNKKSSRKK